MEHHAYLYEGPQNLLDALVASAKKKFKFEGDNNPDLHVESYEKFLIDDAHELARDAQLKSVSGCSLFVLGLASINSHAQQALLKLFEEPQQGIIFVLLVPHGILLPTLRSRLMMYPEKLQSDQGRTLKSPELRSDLNANAAAVFLKASYKTRSVQIAALLKDEDNVKERVREFLSAIEALLYEKLQSTKGSAEYREALEDVAKVQGYLADQSPSIKMLLEHLAATLPNA